MKEWVKNLKVGDMVFVEWRGGTSLRTVEKITRAGNIKVNGVLFNSQGYERGGDCWNMRFLSEATPAAIDLYRKRKVIQKAMKLMRETKEITLKQAREIILLLDCPSDKGGESDNA